MKGDGAEGEMVGVRIEGGSGKWPAWSKRGGVGSIGIANGPRIEFSLQVLNPEGVASDELLAIIENGNLGEAQRLKVGQRTDIKVGIRRLRREFSSIRCAEPNRVRRLARGAEEREVTEGERVVRSALALRDE